MNRSRGDAVAPARTRSILLVGADDDCVRRLRSELPEFRVTAVETTTRATEVLAEDPARFGSLVVSGPDLPAEAVQSFLERLCDLEAAPAIVVAGDDGVAADLGGDRSDVAVLSTDPCADPERLAAHVRDAVATDRPDPLSDSPTAGPAELPVSDIGHDRVATIITDEDDAVTWANESVSRLFGLDRESVVGLDRAELFDSYLADAVVDPGDFADRVRADVDWPEDGTLRLTAGPDGRNRTVTYRRERIPAGPIAGGTIEQFVDVTAIRSRTREAEQFEAIVHSVGETVWMLDTDARFTFVNRPRVPVIDLARDEFVGRSLPELVDELDGRLEGAVDGVVDLVGSVIAGERARADFELTVTGDDGGDAVSVRVVPLERGGEVVGAVGLCRETAGRLDQATDIESSRRKYRGLIETAPDPIFVADAESGEIVEVNEAAVELRGQPREEILGLPQSALHPPGETERYRELFESHVADGGARSTLPNGDQIYAVTASGAEIPVEINAETIELEDRTLIHGIFRDISGRRRTEDVMRTLNEVTSDLMQVETRTEISQFLVDISHAVFELSFAGVHFYDESDGVLYPAAAAGGSGDLAAEPPALGPGDENVWTAFANGETRLLEAASAPTYAVGEEVAVDSILVVPIGDHGVFLASSECGSELDDVTVELVELLASNAEAALDRAERERHLRKRDRELKRQNETLERLEETNAKIRQIFQAIVQADTRGEIESAVCAELVDSERFAFAWIGEHDPVTDCVEPRSSAGASRGYLDSVDLLVTDDEGAEPAVRTATGATTTEIQNTASLLQDQPWRNEALSRDFRAVISIPLTYREVRYGVLTLYSTERAAFDGMLVAVLRELGETVAYAVNAVERKNSLLTDQVVELEFEITDPGCFFLRLAQESDCTITFEGLVPEREDRYLAFVTIEDADFETLTAAASDSEMVVEPPEFISETDGEILAQVSVRGDFLVPRFADHGMLVTAIEANANGAGVTVEITPTMSVHRAVEVVATMFPESDLIGKKRRDTRGESAIDLSRKFATGLTDRQLEAAELAYLRGFFESPKTATGAELAEKMDISTSAFHRHLRIAERHLFEIVFESMLGNQHRRESESNSE